MATALFGVILDQTGNYSNGSTILLRRTSKRPNALTSGVTTTADVLVTSNASGYFRTPLLPGSYFIWIDGSDYQKITVPSAAGDYLLQDLISGSTGGTVTSGINYRDANGQRQLLGSDGNWYVPEGVFYGTVPRIGFAIGNSVGGTPNFQVRNGQLFELLFTDGTYRAPVLENGQAALLAPGATPVSNFRITNTGKFQLYDFGTLNWHTWFIYQSQGAFGPGEA
jgi:hypothetical protein